MLPYNFSDAPGPAVTKEEVVTSPAVVPQLETRSADPLTGLAWKTEESRIMEGNNVSYYKRGGQENTINLDNDLYRFNTDNTGTWTFNGQDYKFTWNYSNAERTKIRMIMQYPTPLIVNLENIVISATAFSYTRLQQANGVNLMAIETRTVK